jgi:hypothetical protein
MSPDEREIILAQSLLTEDNVRVALLVGASFDELRCRIISGFADALVLRLRDRMGPAWSISNRIVVDGFLQRSGAIWAVHHVGVERICVRLMCNQRPDKMYYSILKEETPGQPKINWGRIKQELDTRFAVGQETDTCRWLSPVDPAYRNWYDAEILLKFWRKTDTATYFTNRFSAIMGIVANVIHQK